jgi:hypothetical protein
MYRNSKMPKLYSFIHIKKFTSRKTTAFLIRINQPNKFRIRQHCFKNFKFYEF